MTRFGTRVPVAALGVLLAAGCTGAGSTGGEATVPSPTAVTTGTTEAATATHGAFPPGSNRATFDVDGAERTAIVVVPDDVASPAPLVFAFHGHGGSGRNFQRRQAIEALWPDAVVVYPDGIPGHQGVTDPAGTEPGWQAAPGELDDRDLHFFDTLLAAIEAALPIDGQRIYIMGHSNGSQMAGLVVNQRGERIAAVANLSATPNRLLPTDPVRSMFFAMGTDDPIVPIDHQRAAIGLAEDLLDIDPSTRTTEGDLVSERPAAPSGIELEYLVYPGGHEPPPEEPALVVAFFQRHTLAEAGPP
jgi:polyhydroxybutyrate depolymerase